MAHQEIRYPPALPLRDVSRVTVATSRLRGVPLPRVESRGTAGSARSARRSAICRATGRRPLDRSRGPSRTRLLCYPLSRGHEPACSARPAADGRALVSRRRAARLAAAHAAAAVLLLLLLLLLHRHHHHLFLLPFAPAAPERALSLRLPPLRTSHPPREVSADSLLARLALVHLTQRAGSPTRRPSPPSSRTAATPSSRDQRRRAGDARRDRAPLVGRAAGRSHATGLSRTSRSATGSPPPTAARSIIAGQWIWPRVNRRSRRSQ